MTDTGRATETGEIDLEITDLDTCQYHVEYELFDRAARTGIIQLRSEYRLVKVTRDDQAHDPWKLDTFPRFQIELAIERKHSSPISGI